MSSNPEDVVTSITPINNLYVQGIGGRLNVIDKGTVSWNILDDNRINHKIVISATLYVKSLQYRLFSPQHWSQVANDDNPNKYGTICITTTNCLILQWGQKKFQKTI